MSSLAKKSMLFMRDVYNLASNPGELLQSTTTSTSSQGFKPSQGLSNQFNPAYVQQRPLPPPHPAQVAQPTYQYSYPGPQNAQPYGHWSGPQAPVSPLSPQTAPNVYPGASPAPYVLPNTGRPPSPPSPILSPPIPQPYTSNPGHGVQQYSSVPPPLPARRPQHQQHASSWHSPTDPEPHYQSQLNGSVGAQNLGEFGLIQQNVPVPTSSAGPSVPHGSWAMPQADPSRMPLRYNTVNQHHTAGYSGAVPSESCLPVSDQHLSTAPVPALTSSQLPAHGYHEMPAVASNNWKPVYGNETGTAIVAGSPQLSNGPAAVPLSTSHASHPSSAHPVELASYSCTVEAVELPASPIMAKSSHSAEASLSSMQRPEGPSRYQHHHPTSTAETVTTSGPVAPAFAVELDSTPITAGSSATATATRNNTQTNVVHPSQPAAMYQVYPGPASSPSPYPPFSPPPLASSPTQFDPRNGSSGVLGQQRPPLHMQQQVSSPVTMGEADSVALAQARMRAQTASLPAARPNPSPLPSSHSEPRLQPHHQTDVPYPIHHSPGTVAMPLHHDYSYPYPR
ncbi:hypothetical protein AYO21_05315 [Fonsecaea monophora]|uniref:Uncharacterized protein n=1 Tax=Fonsecaea monophora TaxID=254056 RepID=A0A177F8A3_9EURO|nr:hypothetical protein AYO21_05315 [Fonsecaea monophora]OAG40415.1 hypothetical protein AYO21_05315 [Fonsecaea monophora]